MKWDGDPLRETKYLMFDSIIEFSRRHEGEAFSKISIKDLSDFVDDFCEKYINREEKDGHRS